MLAVRDGPERSKRQMTKTTRHLIGDLSMKIRTLLLGSAAALAAVSGARAADAVVIAEPEPVEYVRVCDTYGAGYFYIPGTETCLQVGGYVWFQVGADGYDGGNDSPDFLTYGAYPDSDGWLAQTRARVTFDARSGTEWGTLRAYIRLEATWGEQYDGPVGVDHGFIQLGGFRAGYLESVWNDSIGAGVAAYGSHSYGSMSYGDQKRHQISYTYGSQEGLAATISLEDDTGNGDSYMPDIVGAISYNQGWGAVWAKAGYDNSYNDEVCESIDGGICTSIGDPLDEDNYKNSGYGVTLGMQYNIPNMAGSSFRLIGYYSDSDNAYSVISPAAAFGGYGASEFSFITSYLQQWTPTFGTSVGFQYFNDYYLPLSDVGTGIDGYAGEIALVWTPIENLEIRSEIYYDKMNSVEGFIDLGQDADYDGKGTFSGFLRMTRFF